MCVFVFLEGCVLSCVSVTLQMRKVMRTLCIRFIQKVWSDLIYAHFDSLKLTVNSFKIAMMLLCAAMCVRAWMRVIYVKHQTSTKHFMQIVECMHTKKVVFIMWVVLHFNYFRMLLHLDFIVLTFENYGKLWKIDVIYRIWRYELEHIYCEYALCVWTNVWLIPWYKLIISNRMVLGVECVPCILVTLKKSLLYGISSIPVFNGLSIRLRNVLMVFGFSIRSELT